MNIVDDGNDSVAAPRLAKKVLVLRFENRTKAQSGRGRLGRAMEQAFNAMLAEAKGYQVMNSRQLMLSQQLRGLPLTQDGIAQKGVVQKLWSQLGPHALVFGEVLEFGGEAEVLKKGKVVKPAQLKIRFTLHLVSTFNATEVFHHIREERIPLKKEEFAEQTLKISPERLEELMAAVVRTQKRTLLKGLSSVPWTGKVIRVTEGGGVYISAGEWTGFRLGEVLNVARWKKGVRTKLGKVRIMEFHGRDQSFCDLKSGGPFTVGDMVYQVL